METSTSKKKEPKPYTPDDLQKRWMYENGTARDLSMTDYFASSALSGLLENYGDTRVEPQHLVKRAYDFAELMVAERSKRYSQ
jgi:hypothetical protein